MKSAELATKPRRPRTIEITGVHPIPVLARRHTRLSDTLWLWWSANLSLPSLAVGMLATLFGLSWGEALVMIGVGTVLGALPVAFLSTLGPKTGMAQMGLARFAFGYQGAKVPALCNVLMCIGWNALSTAAGALLLVAWSGGRLSVGGTILLLTLATTLISLRGYAMVHRFERWFWLPLAVLFSYIAVKAMPQLSLAAPTFAVPQEGQWAALVTFGGAVFAHAFGWAAYAADYTRKQPLSTPARRVFWYAFVGVLVPCVLLETLGVLLALGAPGSQDPGAIVAGMLRADPLAGLVLVVLALSTISNNLPSSYSLGLCLQLMGVRFKRRGPLVGLAALAYGGLALLVADHFAANLERFLLVSAYWLGAWCAIVLVEHRRRGGHYDVRHAEDPRQLPKSRPALLAFGLGLLGAVLGMHQLGFEGPLSAQAFGADLGYPVAMVCAGSSYWLLRARRTRAQGEPLIVAGRAGLLARGPASPARGAAWPTDGRAKAAAAVGSAPRSPLLPPRAPAWFRLDAPPSAGQERARQVRGIPAPGQGFSHLAHLRSVRLQHLDPWERPPFASVPGPPAPRQHLSSEPETLPGLTRSRAPLLPQSSWPGAADRSWGTREASREGESAASDWPAVGSGRGIESWASESWGVDAAAPALPPAFPHHPWERGPTGPGGWRPPPPDQQGDGEPGGAPWHR